MTPYRHREPRRGRGDPVVFLAYDLLSLDCHVGTPSLLAKTEPVIPEPPPTVILGHHHRHPRIYSEDLKTTAKTTAIHI